MAPYLDKPEKVLQGSWSPPFLSLEAAKDYRNQLENQTHNPYKIVTTAKFDRRTGDTFENYRVAQDTNCFVGATFDNWVGGNDFSATQCVQALQLVTGGTYTVKKIERDWVADVYQVVIK